MAPTMMNKKANAALIAIQPPFLISIHWIVQVADLINLKTKLRNLASCVQIIAHHANLLLINGRSTVLVASPQPIWSIGKKRFADPNVVTQPTHLTSKTTLAKHVLHIQ